MEIPLTRYQSISLDQIQSSSGFTLPLSDHKVFKEKSVLFRYPFLLSRRLRRRSVDVIRCCLDQRLQNRPKPRTSRMNIDELKDSDEEGDIQINKRKASICCQIEKLVLCRRYREALDLFEYLEIRGGGFDVSLSTYDALVDACISLKSIKGAKRVFDYINSNEVELDQYMKNRILLMHVKCGMMFDARKLFDEMPDRNFVTWNVIIAGLVDGRNYVEAFRLFLIMWVEYSYSESRMFATMIRASSGLDLIDVGRQLHSCVLKMGVGDDIFVSCALIDMYSKCGSIEDAHFVFEDMPEKTTVGWNSIIAGYALHGYSEGAMNMFYEMRDCRVRMDHFTFSIVIRVCTRLASLEHAKQAHAGMLRHGFGSNIVVNTALVDFYSKWGRIDDARHVFDKMPCKNVISWNALIAGYGNHGRGTEAVEMFERMLHEKMDPNHVTFLAVLSACSYSGLSERGWEFFQSMSRDHRIKPRAMHYACMIELLGREGLLDEALALIRGAPFKPTTNMWAALLTACRANENLELGKLAAEQLYGLEPEKLCNYIVLLNIYNSSGKLKEAAAVLQTLKRKGLTMLPACSWIDVKKQTYLFHSGDKSHYQTKQLYQKVDELMLKISKYDYVSEEKTFLPDVDEHEERIRLYHSEKLAIAFGLINTSDWTQLQIVQNHRICNDCHKVIKLITRVTGRKIVVRDASRFHYFENGNCSCGDYW